MEHRLRVASVWLALACALAAAQAPPPRVTVLPFEGIGVAKNDVQALTLFFETALQNTGMCQIIEQTEVEKILRSHQYVMSDFNDPTKAVEIGRLIPANHIVLGTVGTLSGKYYVNVKMIDLRTGTNVGARKATAAALDQLSESLTDVAGQMMGVPLAAPPPPASPGLSMIPGLPLLRVGLKFFESGQGFPPMDQRVYSTVFDAYVTRFINWELELSFVTALAPLALPLEARYYRGDGSLVALQNFTVQIEAGWDWNACWNGWGAAYPGSWAPGGYTVQLSLASSPVASGSFVVR
jgi:hypothetical protein